MRHTGVERFGIIIVNVWTIEKYLTNVLCLSGVGLEMPCNSHFIPKILRFSRYSKMETKNERLRKYVIISLSLKNM